MKNPKTYSVRHHACDHGMTQATLCHVSFLVLTKKRAAPTEPANRRGQAFFAVHHSVRSGLEFATLFSHGLGLRPPPAPSDEPPRLGAAGAAHTRCRFGAPPNVTAIPQRLIASHQFITAYLARGRSAGQRTQTGTAQVSGLTSAGTAAAPPRSSPCCPRARRRRSPPAAASCRRPAAARRRR